MGPTWVIQQSPRLGIRVDIFGGCSAHYTFSLSTPFQCGFPSSLCQDGAPASSPVVSCTVLLASQILAKFSLFCVPLDMLFLLPGMADLITISCVSFRASHLSSLPSYLPFPSTNLSINSPSYQLPTAT